MTYMNDRWKVLYTQITNSRSVIRHVIENNDNNNSNNNNNDNNSN